MTCIDRERRKLLAGFGAAVLASGVPLRALAQGASAPLILGIQNTSWGAIGMVAEAEKTFQKAGANVTVLRFDTGKTTRDAMIAGRVDIGVLGATPFVVGAAKGEIIGLGISMYAGKTNAIVVSKASGIKSIAELKGRKVASQFGSATDSVFQNKILPKYGLSNSDVQVVNTQFQNQIAALVGKSVDAFAGVEPFPSVAEVEGLGVSLLDYTQFDMVPVILAVNRPVVERKHDAVVAFLRGWLEAAKIVRDTPDRASRVVWNHFKAQGYDISEAVIRHMLTKIEVNPNYKPNLKEYLDEEAKRLVKQRYIAAVPDWDKVLDTQLMRAATGG